MIPPRCARQITPKGLPWALNSESYISSLQHEAHKTEVENMYSLKTQKARQFISEARTACFFDLALASMRMMSAMFYALAVHHIFSRGALL